MTKRTSLTRLGLGLLWMVTACREAKKDDVAAIDASTTLAAAPVAAPSESASTAAPTATRPADELAEVADAGPDGGVPSRRRRLLAAGPDASAIETAPAPPPPAAEPPTPADSARRKAAATPMGNEQPYGASAGSAAPILQKTPLPAEDPWKKPARPSP